MNRAAKNKPTLLSGGNPQIPKANGDAPVQTYIAAMPGWKSDVGHALENCFVAYRTLLTRIRWTKER